MTRWLIFDPGQGPSQLPALLEAPPQPATTSIDATTAARSFMRASLLGEAQHAILLQVGPGGDARGDALRELPEARLELLERRELQRQRARRDQLRRFARPLAGIFPPRLQRSPRRLER